MHRQGPAAGVSGLELLDWTMLPLLPCLIPTDTTRSACVQAGTGLPTSCFVLRCFDCSSQGLSWTVCFQSKENNHNEGK